MNTKSERLCDACEVAVQAFKKINHSDFHEIVSNLEFCVGSYKFDKNPAGLIEYGHKALGMLKEIKKKYPRKISKEVISGMEENLT
jgi:hypothetical protein